MSLCTMKSLLQHANDHHYAVGYFESWDFDSLLAVTKAAEEMNSPVIIGYNGSFVNNAEREKKEDIVLFGNIGKTVALHAKVPISLLLNEADDLQMIYEAMHSGFNAVMYDNHNHSFETLIEINRKLVWHAHCLGVTVEAEVGCLPTSDIDSGFQDSGELTDPELALRFVKETNIDALAISVGNIHLLETGKSSLDILLIEKLHKQINVPLVLHGGTGVSKKDMQAAIQAGICKVNIGTVMKRSYINAMQNYFSQKNISKTNPHDILGKGGSKDVNSCALGVLSNTVAEYIQIFGSEGMAKFF